MISLMPDLFDALVNTTIFFLFMAIPELVTVLLLKKEDDRLRFRWDRRWWSYRVIRRRTWVLALAAFILIISFQVILDTLFRGYMTCIFEGYGWPLVFLTAALFMINYLVIYNYLLERSWDRISYNVSYLIIALFSAFFGFVGIYPWLRYI
jgi:hypothetical protein